MLSLFFIIAGDKRLLWWRSWLLIGEKFHQNCVGANFHNLAKRNKKVHCTLKTPKILLPRHNHPRDATTFQVKHHIHNVPQPAPIHNIHHFLAAKFQQRCIHIALYDNAAPKNAKF